MGSNTCRSIRFLCGCDVRANWPHPHARRARPCPRPRLGLRRSAAGATPPHQRPPSPSMIDPSKSSSSSRSAPPAPTRPAAHQLYLPPRPRTGANHITSPRCRPAGRGHCSARLVREPTCTRAPTQLAAALQLQRRPGRHSAAIPQPRLGLSGRQRFVSATSPRSGGQTHPDSRRSAEQVVVRKESRPFPSPSRLVIACVAPRNPAPPVSTLLSSSPPNESSRAM